MLRKQDNQSLSQDLNDRLEHVNTCADSATIRPVKIPSSVVIPVFDVDVRITEYDEGNEGSLSWTMDFSNENVVIRTFNDNQIDIELTDTTCSSQSDASSLENEFNQRRHSVSIKTDKAGVLGSAPNTGTISLYAPNADLNVTKLDSGSLNLSLHGDVLIEASDGHVEISATVRGNSCMLFAKPQFTAGNPQQKELTGNEPAGYEPKKARM